MGQTTPSSLISVPQLHTCKVPWLQIGDAIALTKCVNDVMMVDTVAVLVCVFFTETIVFKIVADYFLVDQLFSWSFQLHVDLFCICRLCSESWQLSCQLMFSINIKKQYQHLAKTHTVLFNQTWVLQEIFILIYLLVYSPSVPSLFNQSDK